mgnify:CR=1 FL=1
MLFRSRLAPLATAHSPPTKSPRVLVNSQRIPQIDDRSIRVRDVEPDGQLERNRDERDPEEFVRLEPAPTESA